MKKQICNLKLFMTTLLLLTLAITTHAQTWTQAAKVLAGDGEASDFLGCSVDIDGDYAIVGANKEDSMGTDAGAAYIFVRNGSSWTQQAKLMASNGVAGDEFGVSVSINGNYALVGAWYDDEKTTNAGAAYIFVRSGTTWTQQAKLLANDGQSGDEFGTSVAIDGDYALIGAVGDDDKASSAGAAYVFLRSGTTWTQQTKLRANDGQAGDEFGTSVAIDGDYVIVGALLDDDKGTEAGSAYVFLRSGTTWTQQAKLLANDGKDYGRLGCSVSIDGDYAVVGAHFTAYVFVRSGTSWTQQAKLLSNDGEADDVFGESVSIDGDYAVVGAKFDDDKGYSSGSAYVFKRSGTTWTQQAKLLANDGQKGDAFGISVSISGSNIITGAFYEDEKGISAGAAYLFSSSSLVCLSSKAYLQGALLLSSTSTMNDDLRAASLLPSAEPYTNLSGFTHASSGGGESAPASAFTTTGNDAIVDWVFLELRDKSNSSTIVETRSALLQRDGDIVDAADGTSNVCFLGLADPEVYVSVRHRNHLGAMIAATKTLTTSGTTADFSTETLYGSNTTKTVNGVSALWAGNPNCDPKVTYEAAGNDADEVVNSVLTAPGNTLFGGSQGYNYSAVYNPSDVNMDGNVRFESTNNDTDPIINNILAYPGNSLFGGSQGYQNMKEQLP